MRAADTCRDMFGLNGILHRKTALAQNPQ